MASAPLDQQIVAVAPLTNDASISVTALQQENQCRWHSNGRHLVSAWQPCKNWSVSLHSSAHLWGTLRLVPLGVLSSDI